ncbi:sulfite exporter TauE/SafE family protein [Parvularcula sp. IMCC14364]|uniref:sulfite exporter TauE/SafE family protein n=1 Tax=Parvularcula sp. IMCC14364 TaxID=3067902 RepID=UPI0027418159|nr:sulfite exporter TauE/SafE family protein [Parvularcula sp. IMCC14364]
MMEALLTPEMLVLLGLLLGVGLFAGFIGGLFGIGGGIVIVPALYAVFGVLEVPDAIRIKIAVGTSLATIIITSWRSVSTHHRHGAVDVSLLKSWAPWIIFGAISGALLARVLQADVLTLIFATGAMAVAIRKGLFDRQKPQVGDDLAPVPGGGFRASLGGSIGLLSSLMGIGGGVMGVVVLTAFGRTIHQAIATAAGFGLAIAIPGTIGFIIVGWGQQGLPPWSLGFVSVPAFLSIASMTTITAPIGANIAHQLDDTWLNRVFAIYLALTASLLIYDVLF